MIAMVVPASGTVVLRDDGSVTITDRDRTTFLIAAELVAAIARLVEQAGNEMDIKA